MNKNEMRKYLASSGISILEAMRRIDENTEGILILTNHDQRLAGTLTDGDIRRFLLSGGTMEESVLKAANLHPKFSVCEEDAERLYHYKNYIAIPIVDEEKRVIDIYIGKPVAQNRLCSLNIPVVINAGGKGTRLEPFTKILPKPLIPIGELPVIEHIMQGFQKYGCNEFHIIVNYKKELIKAYFAENENKYDIHWYDEEKPLGTGGGLSLLKNRIAQTFFFTNCDNLLLSDYEEILNYHTHDRNTVTMICAHKTFTIPYGVVEMGPDGKIEELKEKPTFSYLTNTGIYVVEPEVLADIEDNTAIGFPDVIEKEREKGKRTAVYPIRENDWLDMGQFSELENMRKKIAGE